MIQDEALVDLKAVAGQTERRNESVTKKEIMQTRVYFQAEEEKQHSFGICYVYFSELPSLSSGHQSLEMSCAFWEAAKSCEDK